MVLQQNQVIVCMYFNRIRRRLWQMRKYLLLLFLIPMLMTFIPCVFSVLLESVQEKKDDDHGHEFGSKEKRNGSISAATTAAALRRRKLLQPPSDGNRIGTECSKNDIAIFQGVTTPLPSGIPSFAVQILNSCASGCSVTKIHVSCGWFSSANLINPRIFRRVYYDDCLVNDGEPLGPGQSLSFQYANSFSYPLSISSAVCC